MLPKPLQRRAHQGMLQGGQKNFIVNSELQRETRKYVETKFHRGCTHTAPSSPRGGCYVICHSMNHWGATPSNTLVRDGSIGITEITLGNCLR